MTYSKLSKEIEQLHYRDKFRLAQLLIQLARKEEEEEHPEQRQATSATAKSKKESLFNSIGAMFQFQGGISDLDKERIFSELQRARYIDVEKNGRIHYPEG
jgi:hypothetical protein